MLVLTRKCNEEVVIDGNITVRVIKCRNGRVRLGIDAPDSVRVVRSEIYFDAPVSEDSQVEQSCATAAAY